MIKYFIYCRKSSEDEERQVLSIEAQLAELREFAKQNNLFIVREFTESKTAKEPGQELFILLLFYCKMASTLIFLVQNSELMPFFIIIKRA